MAFVSTFLEGFFIFVSPCVLPLIPIYLIYLAGNSTNFSLKRRFFNSLFFVAGFTMIFVALGAVATALGSFLRTHLALLQQISAVLMIVLGLAFIFELNILNKRFGRAEAPEISSKAFLGFGQSFLFGMAFAVTWTPCVGVFLAAALNHAVQSESLLYGMALLFVFSMGMGIPFILLSLLYEKVQTSLNVLKRHGKLIRLIGGILLILVGISMLTGLYSRYLQLF